MPRSGAKAPLYRKVNTRTWGVAHGSDGKARYDRNTKRGPSRSMHSGQRHGLDYTPLFRFLLSRVGHPWADTYAEAKARLPDDSPIWWQVARDRETARDVVRIGESRYYSGLYVDDTGLLQVTAPGIGVESLNPQCPCCTHTFNGKRFTRRFAGYPAPPLVDGAQDA
jgi:hypothetical protein